MFREILFLLLFVSVILGACRAPREGFEISGTVNIDSGKVVLKRFEGGMNTPLFETEIQKGGKFVLTGNVEAPVWCMLVIQKTDKPVSVYTNQEGFTTGMVFLLENAEYDVRVDEPQNSFAVEGDGPEWVLFQKVVAINKAIGPKVRALEQEMQAQKADPMKADSLRTLLEPLKQEQEAKEDALIKAHPDSYMATCLVRGSILPKIKEGTYWISEMELASMHLMPGRMYLLPLDKLQEKYDWLSENAKATDNGQRIRESLEFRGRTEPGRMSADVTLQAPDGTSFNMHGVNAKVKLLDFWASWCKPCRAGNPELVEIYKDFHDKGLEIIGVSLDDKKEDWVEAINKDGLPWIHGSTLERDFQSKAAKLYGIGAVPSFYLLDENNRVICRLRHDQIREKLAELLN